MENYVEDILNQLIEEAREIKMNPLDEFEKGKLFGYYFAISKIMSQAEAFNVLKKLPKNLRDFNPEELLDEL